MPLFTQRSSQIEIMDDLHCEGDVVNQTLKELEIINRLLGGNQVTINGIEHLVKQNSGTLSIADLGCGGGDILKLIALWGRKKGITLQLLGIDANPNIINYAKKNSNQFSEIKYTAVNIFSPDFRSTKFDIIVATLFTHHFSNEELVDLFRSLKAQSRIGVVINDLHRHWFAYYSIRLLTKFLSRSLMVKNDAPISVLRAFKKAELISILNKAHIINYTLRWRWAFRWELIIYST